jgi:hypothetical protein
VNGAAISLESIVGDPAPFPAATTPAPPPPAPAAGPVSPIGRIPESPDAQPPAGALILHVSRETHDGKPCFVVRPSEGDDTWRIPVIAVDPFLRIGEVATAEVVAARKVAQIARAHALAIAGKLATLLEFLKQRLHGRALVIAELNETRIPWELVPSSGRPLGVDVVVVRSSGLLPARSPGSGPRRAYVATQVADDYGVDWPPGHRPVGELLGDLSDPTLRTSLIYVNAHCKVQNDLETTYLGSDTILSDRLELAALCADEFPLLATCAPIVFLNACSSFRGYQEPILYDRFVSFPSELLVKGASGVIATFADMHHQPAREFAELLMTRIAKGGKPVAELLREVRSEAFDRYHAAKTPANEVRWFYFMLFVYVGDPSVELPPEGAVGD